MFGMMASIQYGGIEKIYDGAHRRSLRHVKQIERAEDSQMLGIRHIVGSIGFVTTLPSNCSGWRMPRTTLTRSTISMRGSKDNLTSSCSFAATSTRGVINRRRYRRPLPRRDMRVSSAPYSFRFGYAWEPLHDIIYNHAGVCG